MPYFLIAPGWCRPVAAATDSAVRAMGGSRFQCLRTTGPGWPGWLAAGGLLAIANLRGGGEFGTEPGTRPVGWRTNRTSSMIFVAVADHLKQTRVTTSPATRAARPQQRRACLSEPC